MELFKIIEFRKILKGNLAARVKLEMPSGMVITCSILQQKNDPNSFFVSLPAEKLYGGGYANTVEIPDAERARKFQEIAMKTIEPKLSELRGNFSENQKNFTPF